MAGSKKNKLKKAFSPSYTVQNVSEADEEQLMDDLLAELDSRDSTVRDEAAAVIQEVELAHSPPPNKQDSKSRFQARQVRPCYLHYRADRDSWHVIR
jgi:OTU domain-containing protein 6